tara:strand:- start:582 stop:1127 length:546 start_codon:yes stop_codon:yes gene_type:complete
MNKSIEKEIQRINDKDDERTLAKIIYRDIEYDINNEELHGIKTKIDNYIYSRVTFCRENGIEENLSSTEILEYLSKWVRIQQFLSFMFGILNNKEIIYDSHILLKIHEYFKKYNISGKFSNDNDLKFIIKIFEEEEEETFGGGGKSKKRKSNLRKSKKRKSNRRKSKRRKSKHRKTKRKKR